MQQSQKPAISDEQLRLNAALHSKNPKYGNRPNAAGLAQNLSAALIRLHQLGFCDSILDYGTGKGLLVDHLRDSLPPSFEVIGYDPSYPKYSSKPDLLVDIVTCFDVLEHIELEYIDSVLRELHSYCKKFAYLIIDLQPAVKILDDGRNAHILIAPSDWWISRISTVFNCISAFPILHLAGIPQKLVLFASHNTSDLELVYSFILKLKIFDSHMSGGVLQTTYKYRNNIR